MAAADILVVRSLHLKEQEEVGREQQKQEQAQPEDKYNQGEWLSKHDDWLR